MGSNHRLARLAVLEEQSAATGPLTQRTARRRRGRHVAAARPGELCSLDSFYVGKVKGVGKVWQLTACDCASSYGWARIVVGKVTAARMAAFLVEVVLPGYPAAGWALRRVLTDNGKEFKASFVTTLRPTRSATPIKPDMRRPTGSSSACRVRFFMNAGGSSFGAATSRQPDCYNDPWTGSSCSATPTGCIGATPALPDPGDGL